MINKEVATTVRYYLKHSPITRDDDQYLIAMIWKSQLPDPKAVNALDLLGMLANHKLLNFESVRRTRQKLQENEPELRGSKYLKRQAMAKDTRGIINTINLDPDQEDMFV